MGMLSANDVSASAAATCPDVSASSAVALATIVASFARFANCECRYDIPVLCLLGYLCLLGSFLSG